MWSNDEKWNTTRLQALSPLYNFHPHSACILQAYPPKSLLYPIARGVSNIKTSKHQKRERKSTDARRRIRKTHQIPSLPMRTCTQENTQHTSHFFFQPIVLTLCPSQCGINIPFVYQKGLAVPVQLTQFLPDASIRKRRRTFGAKAIRRCPVSHLSPEGTKEEKEEERENAVAHIAASNIQQLVASYVATSSSTAPVRRCPAQTQTPTQSQTRSCQYGPSFHHRHSASWSCSHHPSPAGESSNPSPTQTSSQTLISSMLTPSVDARERLQHPLLGWSKSTR